MKFHQVLNEKFKDAFEHMGKYVEVFTNPDKKEIKSLFKAAEHPAVRMGMTKDLKTTYMWRVDVLHMDLKRKGYKFDYHLTYYKPRPKEIINSGFDIKNKEEVLKVVKKYFPKVIKIRDV